MKLKTNQWLALLFVGAAVLTGCAGMSSQLTPETTAASQTTTAKTTASTTTETTQKTVLGELDPLTGEYVLDAAAVGKRPVAVMVNNLKGALPQYGIEAADIIYELPVEGGITRLMAVYADYQHMPNVCSVRSCRYYYPILCLGMDAIYCHWGSDQTIAKETLQRTGIDHLDGGNLFGSLFFRDPNRVGVYASEHTGYLDGAKLPDFIAKKGFRTDRSEDYQQTTFRFAEPEQPVKPQQLKVNTLTLNFSGAYFSTFQYDSSLGTYGKLHSGNPHIDQSTGNQLRFENVFVLQTDIHTRADGYLMDVSLTGGTGYYAANGGMEAITWTKESETAPIRVFHTDGTELTVSAGKSYIGIIGTSRKISYSE